MDQALADLVRRNIVTEEDAMMKSSNPGKLHELLQHSEKFTSTGDPTGEPMISYGR